MNQAIFSEAARRDRQEITAHTVEHFGIQQARHLRERFEDVLSTLAESPLVGHVNPELDPPSDHSAETQRQVQPSKGPSSVPSRARRGSASYPGRGTVSVAELERCDAAEPRRACHMSVQGIGRG